MPGYFKAFSIFSIWAIIALTTHFYITHQYIDNLHHQKKGIKDTSKNLNPIFSITDDNNNIICSFNGHFTIHNNSSLISHNLNLEQIRDSIEILVNSDYTKKLHIIGNYNQEEINKTANVNLGLNRAKNVKQSLIDIGFNNSKIKTSGNILDFTYNKYDTYLEGIKMSLTDINQSLIDSIEQTITNKTLYIDFNNNELTPDNNLIDYTKNLNQYLKRYPDKKIQIIGHTDNIGYFENNVIKGLKKANKLKEYLIKNAITKTKIETSSKGESQPIANKLTEKGRAQNNRIEIKINSQ